MNRLGTTVRDIDVIGKLADLKDQHYQNLLILTAMLELLVEKGILSPDELRAKTAELEGFSPTPSPHPTA